MSAAVLLGVIAAAATLLGAFAVASRAQRGLHVIELFVAFAAGFMLALALVAAVPEAIAMHPASAAPVILLGYLLVHFSQHTLAPHFHFGEETHRLSKRASQAAVAGLLLHTFFDGVAIASGFLVDAKLGVLFFLGIVLHKLPEGVAVASLVLAAGGTVRASYLAAASMGVATILGVMLTSQVSILTQYGLALSAGVTIYVAASNLVPEFQHKRSGSITVAFFAGAAAFLLAHWALERALG